MRPPIPCQTKGFTLVELFITLAIMAILTVMLFPAIAAVRERANNIACQNNLRKIGYGMLQYANDNDGRFPAHWGNDVPGPSLTWYGFIAPYVNGWDGDLSKPMSKDFFCPSSAAKNRRGQTYTSTKDNSLGMSYGYNYYPLTKNFAAQRTFKAIAINTPGKLVLAGDIPVTNEAGAESGISLPGYLSQYLLYPGSAVLSTRHNGSCNLVFADGHVESRNAARLAQPGEEFDLGNWDPRY